MFKAQGQEEDIGKYIAVLSDEFFGLLITIVSARYNPGVGQVFEIIWTYCTDRKCKYIKL